MTSFFYCYKDRLASFSDPFLIPMPPSGDTDSIAIRNFTHQILQAKPENFPSDLELYRVGSYNTDTGVIMPCNPELVAQGQAILLAKENDHAKL